MGYTIIVFIRDGQKSYIEMMEMMVLHSQFSLDDTMVCAILHLLPIHQAIHPLGLLNPDVRITGHLLPILAKNINKNIVIVFLHTPALCSFALLCCCLFKHSGRTLCASALLELQQ